MATIKEKNTVTPLSETRTSTLWPAIARIAILVVGDALVFFVFAAIGRRSHSEVTGLAAIPQIALTAAPFAAGWFLIAPFLGLYRRDVTTQPRKMIVRTLLAWVIAWPVGMTMRGIFVDHGIPPTTFAIITLISNTVLLLIWRWPYALVRKRWMRNL